MRRHQKLSLPRNSIRYNIGGNQVELKEEGVFFVGTFIMSNFKETKHVHYPYELSNQSLPTLTLALISSNKYKFHRFLESLPDDSTAVQSQPHFDEDEIKENLKLDTRDGINYVTTLSQAKLKAHRKYSIESEHVREDEIFLTSDSVMLIGTNEGYEAVPRKITEEKKIQILNQINREKRVVFSGSVSFGRKWGTSTMSTTTIIEIPIQDDVSSLPIDIDELEQNYDSRRPIITAYVKSGVNQMDNGYTLVHRGTEFSDARSYISGLTPEVVQLAHEAMAFEATVSPIISDMIANHAYNTLSFYNHLDGTEESYSKLLLDAENYFKVYGGNCNFFTLDLLKKLKINFNLDGNVIIYPAETKNFYHKNGHSGIIVQHKNLHYLLDPGIGLPYPLPISQIPISPVQSGNKHLSLNVRVLFERQVADVIVYRKRGSSVILAQEVITPDEFEKRSPQILSELHKERPILKYTVQNKLGSVLIEWLFDRDKKELSIKDSSRVLWTGSITQYFLDTELQEGINSFCSERSITLGTIHSELNLLSNNLYEQ